MKSKRKYKPNHIPESAVEGYLVRKVTATGGLCIKGNPHNQRGMPDRICIFPEGVLIFVEVKRPGLKPRPNQRWLINKLVQLGHHAVWVNSFGMIDKLIDWYNRTKVTKTVVGTEQVCTRPECERRVKEPWTRYLQKENY